MPRVRPLRPEEQAQLQPRRPGRPAKASPVPPPPLIPTPTPQPASVPPDDAPRLHPVITAMLALQQEHGWTDKELAYRFGGIEPERWRRIRLEKSQPTEALLRYLGQRLPSVIAGARLTVEVRSVACRVPGAAGRDRPQPPPRSPALLPQRRR